MTSEDAEQNPFTRPSFIASAVVVALVVALGLAIVNAIRDATDIGEPHQVDEDIRNLVLNTVPQRGASQVGADLLVGQRLELRHELPNSPDNTIARFFGMWNWPHSRASANWRTVSVNCARSLDGSMPPTVTEDR